MLDTKFERYFIGGIEDLKYVKYGKQELAFLLDDKRFLSLKNCNPKFKKHLGFTIEFIKVPIEPKKGYECNFDYRHRVTIYDKKKLMMFRIKYGL